MNTTGQGRQAQGQAIVTTRHRPTPTLPRRNTVSQSPIYRPSLQPVAAVYEARRGEARPESEPEVNLDWELHSPTFLQSRLPLPQHFTLGRSINQPVNQSQIYHPPAASPPRPSRPHSSYSFLFLLPRFVPFSPILHSPIPHNPRNPAWINLTCLCLLPLCHSQENKTSIQGRHPLRVVVGKPSDRIPAYSHANATLLRILE